MYHPRFHVPSDATLSVQDSTSASAREPELATALVIVWSSAEPERVGEVMFAGEGASVVLGRDHDGADAALFARQRPGVTTTTGPIHGPHVSRKQLKLRERMGALTVERVGRCPTFVNGEETERAVLVPGDTLLLKNELLLYCVARPRALPPTLDWKTSDDAPFGTADRFELVGESPAAWELRDQIAFAARASAHVLVLGESGTGKELCARAIHALSPRARGKLVSRNAATLPAGLVDAELFGNVKNYPNPGSVERAGLIGEAHEGTLFLDEIGELPSELQAHLLRVLDAGGEYHRLGESAVRRSDLRLVAATNRDPAELKHDLLPRLALRVELPPLAARREDIPLIVRRRLELAAERAPEVLARFRAPAKSGRSAGYAIESALVDALLRRDLPGNVRDLDAILWSSMSASRSGSIAPPRELLVAPVPPGSPEAAAPPPTPPVATPPVAPTADAVRSAIVSRQGNLLRAASDLGLPSRYALYRLLKKFDIDLADLRNAH